ncbi:unnamed protein product, partial [Allacma fusca]
MGKSFGDPGAVVDSRLRVLGTIGLRVIDASVNLKRIGLLLLIILLDDTNAHKFERPRKSPWYRQSMYSKSIPDIQSLENMEIHIVKTLTSTLFSPEKKYEGFKNDPLLHSYMSDYYNSSGYSDIEDAIRKEDIHISNNPICSYRLIHRVKFLLRDLVSQKLFRGTFRSLSWKIAYFFLQYSWPRMEDLETSAEKILRIQHVYDLGVENLTKGLISNVSTNCTLSSSHCYDIARMATKTEQFASGIEWLELAKEKAVEDKKSSIPFIEFSLWNALEQHNEEFDDEIKMDMHPLFFDREITHVFGDRRNATKLRTLQWEEYKGMKENFYVNINYLGLCSGENLQTEKEKSQLFCWYEFKMHLSLTVGPMRLEFLSRDPDVVQIYEVLHEWEIQTMLTDCTPLLVEPPLSVVGYNTLHTMHFAPETSFRRSPATCSCEPSNIKIIEKRLERVTGLAIEGTRSEALRLLSYTTGGHNLPHFDGVPDMDQEKTPNIFRIASLMLYICSRLNNVEKGGGTAFPSLGFNAKPVKGSVLLWFNFYPDGSEDSYTYHGGCPVALGVKWAANKWINYGAQTFKRQCGLIRDERLKYPVNNVI